jgi:hypothetical protein
MDLQLADIQRLLLGAVGMRAVQQSQGESLLILRAMELLGLP